MWGRGVSSILYIWYTTKRWRVGRSMIDSGVTYNELPVIPADDDFIEHLYEHGFNETIDIAELNEEWNDWAKENLV
jgi:hypothetical protein